MVSIAIGLVEELLVRYLAQLCKRRQVRLTVATVDTAMQERIYSLSLASLVRSVALVKPHQALGAYSNMATATDQLMVCRAELG